MTQPTANPLATVAWCAGGAIVVCACAAASVFWGLAMHASIEGMIAGIVAWVAIYVVFAASPLFRAWRRRRGVANALCVVYGLRILIPAAMLLKSRPLPQVAILDMWIGALSLRVCSVLVANKLNFISSAMVTVVDGLLQQIPLAILFGLAYLVVRPLSRSEQQQVVRGFEVLPASVPQTHV